MIIIAIILECIIICLLISIVYSLGHINQQYQTRISRVAINLALVQHQLDKLTGAINKLLPEGDAIDSKESEGDAWTI